MTTYSTIEKSIKSMSIEETIAFADHFLIEKDPIEKITVSEIDKQKMDLQLRTSVHLMEGK